SLAQLCATPTDSRANILPSCVDAETREQRPPTVRLEQSAGSRNRFKLAPHLFPMLCCQAVVWPETWLAPVGPKVQPEPLSTGQSAQCYSRLGLSGYPATFLGGPIGRLGFENFQGSGGSHAKSPSVSRRVFWAGRDWPGWRNYDAGADRNRAGDGANRSA